MKGINEGEEKIEHCKAKVREASRKKRIKRKGEIRKTGHDKRNAGVAEIHNRWRSCSTTTTTPSNSGIGSYQNGLRQYQENEIKTKINQTKAKTKRAKSSTLNHHIFAPNDDKLYWNGYTSELRITLSKQAPRQGGRHFGHTLFGVLYFSACSHPIDVLVRQGETGKQSIVLNNDILHVRDSKKIQTDTHR